MTETTARVAMHPPEMNRHASNHSTDVPLSQFIRRLGHPGKEAGSLNKFLDQMFVIREAEGEERTQTESFIHECFGRAYGADVTSFMPRLLELRTRRGELTAAFGVRCAADAPLFLETYLDAPIDEVLERKLGYRPSRAKIVEIGNLAAIYPGAVRWLIVALTVRLYQEGYQWVVFTGTTELKNGFHRLGLRPIPLASASIEQLSIDQRAGWGSYYDTLPTVMAGSIGYGYHEIQSHCEFPKAGEISYKEVIL